MTTRTGTPQGLRQQALGGGELLAVAEGLLDVDEVEQAAEAVSRAG